MEVWFFFCTSMPWLLRLTDAQNKWIKKNDTCYMFSTFDLTWTESEEFCRVMKSNLTMVKSLEQHVFLQTHIIEISANVGRNTPTYWIGAKYNKSLEEYRWLDGSMMNVSGWGKNQPDSTGCVYYSYFHGWDWSGRKKCKRTVGHFICENPAKKSHNSSSCPEVDPCAVWQTGYYEPLCEYSCPKGCANKTCDKRFSSRCKNKCPKHCSACVNRRKCTACRNGFWGPTCKNQCDDMCLNGTCYFRTGNCSKLLSEQQNNKTMTTASSRFHSLFTKLHTDISEKETETGKHSAECNHGNNRTRNCSKDSSEQQKNKIITTTSLSFSEEPSKNISGKKTVLNKNSSSCDFRTENCSKPLSEQYDDNTGTTASFNFHASSDEPRENVFRNKTETSENSPTCFNGTENCSKHMFDEQNDKNLTAASFDSSSDESQTSISRNETEITRISQQTNKSMTTKNLNFNSSSDEARKNKLHKNSTDASCQFKACNNNVENPVTVGFRLSEIISEHSWSLTFLVVGSCATFSLTFVAVVGIYCILYRRSRKKRRAGKRRNWKDTKSKKPGTKRNRKQKAASNVDDDSSFSDHLPDWQNVAFDHLFSQYREDNNRDSVGSIFPK